MTYLKNITEDCVGKIFRVHHRGKLSSHFQWEYVKEVDIHTNTYKYVYIYNGLQTLCEFEGWKKSSREGRLDYSGEYIFEIASKLEMVVLGIPFPEGYEPE